MAWSSIAQKALRQGKYKTVITLYEQKIQEQPNETSHYWYLGLAYLLKGEESTAQEIWISQLTQATAEDFEGWGQQLMTLLKTEALAQETLKKYHLAERIRWQIYQLDATDINNALDIILLSFKQKKFTPQLIEDLGLIEGVQEVNSTEVDPKKLQSVLTKILPFPTVATVELIEAGFPHIPNPKPLMETIMKTANEMTHDHHKPTYSVDLTKICLKFKPDDFYLLNDLLTFYQHSKNTEEALKTAHQLYQCLESSNNTKLLKTYITYRLLLCFIRYGAWTEAKKLTDTYYNLLSQLLQEDSPKIDEFLQERLVLMTFPLPYLGDRTPENRNYINKIAEIFQQETYVKFKLPKSSFPPRKKASNQPLKIGYIAHTLRKHSVGWLSRWLFHYHNLNKVEIFLYLVNQSEDELTEKWFKSKAKKTYKFSRNPQEIAQQIRKDKVDILVDLDSLTHNLTCHVLALKPAPIQVSWLGFDATGLPSVDYFIVDPYVVPENAQEYYRETLWRLPQTYLAVDGFEIGKQTRFRQDLGIPEDAIVYLTIQNQQKLNPDSVKSQLQIIANVPNSYLLTKFASDPQFIKPLYYQLA
jgi:predicted O-linked N-acetylglucosamine transferase (SPINDLY family)